jgi:N-acetylmuramoyl-L-alanine amidase
VTARACRCAAILLWVSCAAVAQEAPVEEQPAAAPPTVGAVVSIEGGAPVAMAIGLGPAGPLFPLAPLAAQLGSTLRSGTLGQGYELAIGDTTVVLGPQSPAITLGREITMLSTPVTEGPQGPLVPLDFLQKTFGALRGYAFEWLPAQQRLEVTRRGGREMPVAVDVVHLQGVSTVVMEFPEPPLYRIVEREGGVDVEIQGGDHLLAGAPRPAAEDPLVAAVAVEAQRVRLDLRPGAVSENYVLRNPFRLVFDVHEASVAMTPQAPPPRPPVPTPGVQTIVIDPGHGGTETGAISTSGTAEKELTLLLAQALKRRLEDRLGVRVVLTRDEDASLPLTTRTALANQFKADLFLSIHLNSSPGSSARGAETYFLSEQASDASAESSAQAENQTSGEADEALYGLQLILWDLAQSRHLQESQKLAGLIQGELNSELQLRDRGVKQAPFRVLRGAAMPAVLLELGFLSNPEEEKKLLQPEYRAQLADALVRAVSRYRALGAEPRQSPSESSPAAAPQPSAAQPASPGPAGPPRDAGGAMP